MGDPVQEVVETPADSSLPEAGKTRRSSPRKRSSRSDTLAALLFHPVAQRDLRNLASVRRVLIHYTSIDPLGDYIAGEIEILDDRIKRDSFSSVVGALVSRAHGAPLKAISRALGGAQSAFLYQATDIVERSAHGIYGEVAGTEVTVGDEELLLERGVILDSLADSLVEEGQSGFYLLIAVGDSIIARCLVTPPRIGDGRELIKRCQASGIDVEVLSLGSAGEAQQCATELGLTGEQVRTIESSLHLDALLEQAHPFVLLTSDADCAEYVAGRGLVAFFADSDRANPRSGLFCMRSFDLRGLVRLRELAQREVRAERLRWGAGALVICVLIAAAAWLFF